MAKDKMKKKFNKGPKRLSGGAGTSAAFSAGGSGKRGNRTKRSKRTTNGNADARITAKRAQQSRGRTGRQRQGNPAPLMIRRTLGAGIRDARQIINSHQGVKSRRAAVRSSQSGVFNSALRAAVPPLNSPAFGDAVRAAVAPLLRGVVGSAPSTPARVPSSSSYSAAAAVTHSNGPCSLRVANLAQSVTINDLADLFSGYQGFSGADMESPGIAIVHFERRESATTALDEYNTRELDGRTMMIQLDTGHAASSRLGPKPSHATLQTNRASLPATRTVTAFSPGQSRATRADQRWNEIRATCDM